MGTRSPSRIAKRCKAAFHFCSGMVHFLAMCSRARYSSFRAASWLGKDPPDSCANLPGRNWFENLSNGVEPPLHRSGTRRQPPRPLSACTSHLHLVLFFFKRG